MKIGEGKNECEDGGMSGMREIKGLERISRETWRKRGVCLLKISEDGIIEIQKARCRFLSSIRKLSKRE
jgi:hypothetical protein